MLIEDAVKSETFRFIDGEWWKYPGGQKKGRRRCVTGVCKRCDGEFVTTPIHPSTSRTGEFCSRRCKRGWQKDNARPNETGVCPNCGCEWSRRPRGDGKPQTYCSRQCLSEHRRRQRVGECDRCGDEFIQTQYPEQKYCSPECYWESNQGEGHVHFNGYLTQDKRGYWYYSKSHPEHPGRPVHSVKWHDQNPGEPCENCGVAPVDHVHHIDEDPANNDLANLMGLCMPCHIRHHVSHDPADRVG